MDPGDAVDVTALVDWLKRRLGGDGEVVLSRIGVGVGVANVLHTFSWNDIEVVMRRPPAAAAQLTPSAGNMLREARVLAALRTTNVPHPELVAVCEDVSVIGSPFLLMRKVDGFTPVDPLPDAFVDASVRHALGLELVRALAAIALVDWQDVGLDGYGRPEGFLARQVERWLWQLNGYERTRPLPHLDDVVAWLEGNLPEPGPTGLIHGDYSLFNVMFGHDVPARLAAVLDWDTSTIGEPLLDIGHVLARWDEPDEEPTTLGSSDIGDRTGFATRAEMLELYRELTGIDVTNVRYYEVLSLFKLACLMEGHYSNEVRGVASGGRFADSAPGLLADALRIARGERP